MMRRNIFLFAAVIATASFPIILPTTSHAYITETGNDFLVKCDGELSDIELAYCLGRKIGTWDGIAAMVLTIISQNSEAESGASSIDIRKAYFFACTVEGSDFKQIMDVALAYIRNNPSTRHHPDGILMRRAWVEAFPCKE